MTSRSKRSGGIKAARSPTDDDFHAMAKIVASLVRRESGVDDLIEDLCVEGRRQRPRDKYITGYATMLTSMLGELRLSVSGGDTSASPVLADARRVLDAEIAKGGIGPGVLLARAFAQAGLDPGPSLQGAMAAATQARPVSEQAPDPAAIAKHFDELAVQHDQDPFAIHAEIAEISIAFPAEFRGALAQALVQSDLAVVREAAVGFVLAAEAARETILHWRCSPPQATPPSRPPRWRASFASGLGCLRRAARRSTPQSKRCG